MSRLIPGGPIPLFDKLDQRFDAAHGTEQVLDIDGVEASVVRELQRLLNSRSPVPLSAYEDAALTVLDYGIPDYGAQSAQSEADRRRVAAAIHRSIAAFEPRLSDVSVSLIEGATGKTIALFCIAATLRVANTVRRINFTLNTGEYLAAATIAEPA
ncbi:MAG: hypothetical protein RL404_2521 [Pseudomonadota bacterium]|jgi:type VI secretion system protein ImpF